MVSKNNFYENHIVNKPWGYEYVVFNNKKVAITFLNIKKNKKTSLHCHPQKKTGFIILNGAAIVQIGLYSFNSKKYKPLSRLVFRQGLFHSLKSISKKGLYALEFETPFNKLDLVRFEDDYGREKKPYEGKVFLTALNKNLLKFKKPKNNQVNKYIFKNIIFILKYCDNFRFVKNNDEKSSIAILDGKIVDSLGKTVISYGEVVKAKTLKILSKKFIIKKPLLILQVSRL
jgi:hypothetical protein